MKKEKYLDGVRGMAAFIVVIYHYVAAFYPALYTGNVNNIKTSGGVELFIVNSPFNILYDGSVSVCIFFILSGYVLTYKYFKDDDIQKIRSTAIRRYIRLVIPVVFSVFIAYIILKLKLFYNIQAAEVSSSEWLKGFYNFEPNVFEMIKQAIYGVLFKQSTTYNPVLWTMYYEFYGSFLVIAFALMFGKVRNRWIVYSILLVLTFNNNFLPFVLGLMLSDCYNTKKQTIQRYINKSINIVFIILGLLLASYPPAVSVENTMYAFMKLNYIENASYFYHSIGAFFIMVVILNSNILKRVFSTKVFQFLGSISFSVYIIHFLILNSFSSYLFIQLSPFLRYYQVVLIVMIVSLGMIILISYYVYKYVDMSGIKLSKYLYKEYFCKIQNNKTEKIPS